MRDVTFHSAALKRDMHYRVLLPMKIGANTRLPVIYLLHGGGGNLRDWTNYTDVAHYAGEGFVLVLPQGDDSYYMNSSTNGDNKYEDYITKDLTADVERTFPVLNGRAGRGIAGVSMGGFGAITIGLRHRGLYAFAGGLSPALDVPSRPFSIKRVDQWRHHRSIFGAWNGQQQHSEDPYLLVTRVDPKTAPYIFFTCGDQEGLLPANRKFDALLKSHGYYYEFHQVHGGHEWRQWAELFPALFKVARDQLQAGTGNL